MENLGLIIAIVGSVVALVGVVCALFLWSRGEANADRREGRAETSQLRRDLIDCVRSLELSAERDREKYREEKERDREKYREEKEKSDRQYKEDRKEANDRWERFNERWLQESKDFHNRLCEIQSKKSP